MHIRPNVRVRETKNECECLTSQEREYRLQQMSRRHKRELQWRRDAETPQEMEARLQQIRDAEIPVQWHGSVNDSLKGGFKSSVQSEYFMLISLLSTHQGVPKGVLFCLSAS